jgi:hypothetical protein
MAHHFTQPTPGTDTNNRRSQPFTDHKAVAIVRKLVGSHTQVQKGVPPDTPRLPQMGKVFFPSQAQMALHVGKNSRLTLPVDPLHVIVHFRCQLRAAPCAARFEHFPPIAGLHTLAKSMDAQTAALLGLVSTLWHLDLFF